MEFKFLPKKLSEIKALKIEVVNKGYIPFMTGRFNLLAGAGGTGKSLIALKSAIIYLRDNPNKKAFLWFSEDPKIEIEKRVKAICDELISVEPIWVLERMVFVTLETDDRIPLVQKNSGGIEKNSDYIAGIIEYILLNDIGFVVLDPLKRFHLLDENSNSEMPMLTKGVFEYISAKTNALILVLHHSSKSVHGVRGAGSIADDAGMAWIIAKVTVKDNITEQSTVKEGFENRVSITFQKDNYGITKGMNIMDKYGTIPLPGSMVTVYE